MRVVITDEDTVKYEEQVAVDSVKALLDPHSPKREHVERAIRRMAANIINSQPWRHS